MVDKFVKGIGKKMLATARLEEVYVMLEKNGDIRYKMIYEKRGWRCEAVVVRTEKNTLELVMESSLTGERVSACT